MFYGDELYNKLFREIEREDKALWIGVMSINKSYYLEKIPFNIFRFS
jgi:hypothetical protein